MSFLPVILQIALGQVSIRTASVLPYYLTSVLNANATYKMFSIVDLLELHCTVW